MRNAAARAAGQGLALVAVALAVLLAPAAAGAAPAKGGADADGSAAGKAMTAQERRAERRAHIAKLRRAERRLEKRSRAAEEALLAAQDAKDLAQDRYEHALETYTHHVVTVYTAGDSSRLSSLIAARDMGTAIDTALVVGTLLEHDRRVLVEYREAAEAAARHGDEVEAAFSRVVATGKELDDVRSELAGYEKPKFRSGASDDAPAPLAEHFFTTEPLSLMPLGGSSFLPLTPAPGLGSFPLVPGAGAAVPPTDMPAGLRPTGQVETGIASWYGPGFDGKTTANGETYDMHAMTAAHKTLPFDTWVKVTSDTGRSTYVRINDRGPFVEGRIIDLSFAAAQAIGMDGTAPVRVEILG